MPFKQKGGMVCVDKKIIPDDRFVPCNKKGEMVYQRGFPEVEDAQYPPLYESSEADIYNLLNPTEVPRALEYNRATLTVGPGLEPKAFEKKGKKLNKLGHEINIKERGERAFEVKKLPDYLGKPHTAPANLFLSSAFDDFERLNPEGKEYLKQLILTTIRRRVNNEDKRKDIAAAYYTPWPTDEYDRGGLLSPDNGITIDTHFASEPTGINKVNKIYEAIVPNNGYWKPEQLQQPLRGGAAAAPPAAPPAPVADEEITFGDFPAAPPMQGTINFGDFPPGYLPEFERNPSAMALDTMSQEDFQERFGNRNILDAPPAVDRGGPKTDDFKEGGIHGNIGLRSKERTRRVGAPRAHNLEKIFAFAEAIGLQEGDVKDALQKSDEDGDEKLYNAKAKYLATIRAAPAAPAAPPAPPAAPASPPPTIAKDSSNLSAGPPMGHHGGGKRKASKKRRNNKKRKTKKRKSIKKKKKATRR